MVKERINMMGKRTGLLGWFDRIRFNELLRQGLGLLLVAVCAYFARPDIGTVSIGLALVVVGQVFRIYAAGYIFKNKQLASTGPYSLVRHPLYLGNFIILIGFTLASANLYVAAVVVLFFLIWYPAAIAATGNVRDRRVGRAEHDRLVVLGQKERRRRLRDGEQT